MRKLMRATRADCLWATSMTALALAVGVTACGSSSKSPGSPVDASMGSDGETSGEDAGDGGGEVTPGTDGGATTDGGTATTGDGGGAGSDAATTGSDGGADAATAASDGGSEAAATSGDAGSDAATPTSDGGTDAAKDSGGTSDASEAGACTTLTVKNFDSWCTIAVGAAATKTDATQTTCVAPGSMVTLVAMANPIGGFEVGPAPWNDIPGDGDASVAGTQTGSGGSAQSSVNVTVGSSNLCVYACCPFSGGSGCSGIVSPCP